MYGRGSNDDLGSGVIGTLTAMRRLVERPDLSWNVRLVACCDEETGGAGGVEAIKARDDRLPKGSPERILLGDVALIPDGDPHTSAASSGVAFGDGRFERPVPLSDAVAFGRELVSLHVMARMWKSQYPSPDWPDHGAPEPVITGRASVTRFDLESKDEASSGARIRRIHAETDASNQVAQSVTFLVTGGPDPTHALALELERRVRAPFRWQAGGRTALVAGTDEATYQLVGESTHGGYPHRGHNPVPAALELVSQGIQEGFVDGSRPVQATFALDLRLPPEMDLARGMKEAQGHIIEWCRDQRTAAILEFPPERCRGGYALALDHPLVRHVDRVLVRAFGRAGIYGEYGGTDASSLVGVRTPAGEQLPAVVFGSMDRQSHIHEAEESVDPSALRGVIQAIEQFATEP